MKRIMISILVLCILAILVVIWNNSQNKYLKVQIDPNINQLELNKILDEIDRKSDIDRNQCYLIKHFTPHFYLETFKNGDLKRVTLSLAIVNKEGTYDIYQIRKKSKNYLSVISVDKKYNFEELRTPIKTDKVFKSLQNLNWDNVIKELPDGDLYTFRYWGLYKEGEKIIKESGIYHSYSPSVMYEIDSYGKLKELKLIDEAIVNYDTVFTAITVLDKYDYGYSGSASRALLLELKE